MDSDTTLQRDVIDALALDPSIDAARIGVIAKNGIVTLTGTVASYAQKLAAEAACRRVSGLDGIADELTVDLPVLHRRSDADIARSAADALAYDVTIPADSVVVTVTNGWLTLSGVVDWHYQKDNAAHDVRRMVGVRGVANEILVQEDRSTPRLRDDLRGAFANRSGAGSRVTP